MTEPAQYPRSVAGLMVRAIGFFALAGVITWWIAPHHSLLPLATTKPASQAPHLIAGKSVPSSAYVHKLDNDDGGHWSLFADGATMRSNRSGSSLQLNLHADFHEPQMAALQRARTNALRTERDSPLNITDDQRKQLRALHSGPTTSSANDYRDRMRQAWTEYQASIVDPSASADAKGAADAKLTEALAQTAAADRAAYVKRYSDFCAQIQKILTPDQIKALSPRRPKTKKS